MGRRDFFVAAACAITMSGCATTGEVLEPSIALANVTLERAGLLRQDLLLDVRIGNPNDFDIPIDGLTLQLDIDGARFAEGFSNARVTLPRLSEVSLPVRASADTSALLERIFALGRSLEIRYRLHGFVYVPGITASRRVAYDREGQLSLAPGLPPPRREATDPVRLAPQ